MESKQIKMLLLLVKKKLRNMLGMITEHVPLRSNLLKIGKVETANVMPSKSVAMRYLPWLPMSQSKRNSAANVEKIFEFYQNHKVVGWCLV